MKLVQWTRIPGQAATHRLFCELDDVIVQSRSAWIYRPNGTMKSITSGQIAL